MKHPGSFTNPKCNRKGITLPSPKEREWFSLSVPNKYVPPQLFCLCTQKNINYQKQCVYIFLFLVPQTTSKHKVVRILTNLLRRVWFSLNDDTKE
jgi:hypothetical protein